MKSWVVRLFLLGMMAHCALEAAETLPEEMEVVVGEMRSIPAEALRRVAISDPEVADVTVVSENELLLQAKRAGSAYVLFWDQAGQRTMRVEVIDRTPEETKEQLERLLTQLNLVDVRVKQEGIQLFLTGEVPSDKDQDLLDGLIQPFAHVSNLVLVRPTPPPPPTPPPVLVGLSVQVIELDKTSEEKLGINWNKSVSFTEQPIASVAGKGDATTSTAISAIDTLFKRHSAPFRVGTLFRTGFTATLDFLVSKGKARLLAEPKLVTTSGKEATSFMGRERPIVTSTAIGTFTGGVTASIEFKNEGVSLRITPTVNEDKTRILTVLEAEVSSVDTASGIKVATGTTTVDVPGFKTRKAQTEVSVTPGETIVIAGLLQTKDEESVEQLPALGSIPVVGRLFRSPSQKTSQTDLIITVTPELLEEPKGEDRIIALEQSLAAAEVTAAVEDPVMRYGLSLQQRISEAIRYPQREKELGLGGRVKLRMHVFADGTLGKVLIAESSGFEALDVAAIKAAELQSPYPAFPIQLASKDLWLDVPIIFRP